MKSEFSYLSPCCIPENSDHDSEEATAIPTSTHTVIATLPKCVSSDPEMSPLSAKCFKYTMAVQTAIGMNEMHQEGLMSFLRVMTTTEKEAERLRPKKSEEEIEEECGKRQKVIEKIATQKKIEKNEADRHRKQASRLHRYEKEVSQGLRIKRPDGTMPKVKQTKVVSTIT